MANVIRHKRDQPTKRGLKKGNTVVGTGEENYGPSSTTGYVAGITPPAGGYTIYTLSGENDPAIYVAESDNDLPAIARTLGGGELTPLQAKNYLRRRFNTWVLDSVPDNTITDGLALHLDAKNQSSFINNQPTTNLLAAAGSDPEIERSGTSYPYYSVNIDSLVQAQWSATNNVMSISFEGKRDYVAGGTGGGNDGYPVFYVYFTDWSWASTLGITSYDWSFNNKTFTMPDPTGKSVRFAIYHMNAGNRGKSYSRKHQIEFQPSYTEFVNGTRNENPIWKDISGNKKPLSELRVLGAHHSGYQYPPFYNYFRTNCQMVNEPVVNDLPTNWPPNEVADQFDLVIADEYVWAMGSGVIDWMKECVDLGVSCIGIGNDQRGTTFVSGYNSGTRQAHDIRMDSKSPFGLQGRIFGYGSGDVYGGITELQNGAIPVYYRDDVDRITGYVYENDDTGAALWFDQEGLQGTTTELFEAGVDYLTRNIGNRGFLYNGVSHNSNGWFDFDGVNDYIYFKNLPTFDMYCFEIVFKPHKTISPNTGADNNAYSLVGFGRDVGNNNGINLYEWTGGMTNETLTFWSHDGFATGITDTIDTNFHHAVFNWNGSTYDIWLDGVQKSTIQRSTGHAKLQTNVSAISPGKNIGYNYYHSGSIAKIKSYDRSLTDNEIKQNYYGGSIVTDGLVFAIDPGNLVSYTNGSTTAYSLTGSVTTTLNNGVGWNINSGGSWNLDGVDDYLLINSMPINPIQPYTILMWLKPETLGTGASSANRSTPLKGSGQWNPGIWVTQDMIRSHGDKRYVDSYIDWSGLEAAQIGMIYDGTTVYNIFNGEILSNFASTAYNPGEPTVIILGNESTSPGSYNWDGDISNTLFYDRVLTPDELKQNFNAQKARFGL